MKITEIPLSFKMHINRGSHPHTMLHVNEEFGIYRWSWSRGIGKDSGRTDWGIFDGKDVVIYKDFQEFSDVLCRKFPEIEVAVVT